jgi:hypothetical protein
MMDALDHWLADDDERETTSVDVTDVFVQLDALHDERRERHDQRWQPPGPDPQGLERLVEDRWRRGVLRLPGGRRAR